MNDPLSHRDLRGRPGGHGELFLGGPDRPPRALRDLLQAHIEAVPAGGEIVWATYYFRDRALADALIAAARRGVRVRLAVEERPRLSDANAAVLARLREGLPACDLRLHRAAVSHSHLHAKIYAFSHPYPLAFVGSFNPSGDSPDDPEVVGEIGDQDRGHNLLVRFDAPAIVAGLRSLAAALPKPFMARFSPRENHPLVSGSTRIHAFPRFAPGVLERSLHGLGQGCRVSVAASHMRGYSLPRRLARAARRGAEVRVVAHDSERRVPTKTLRRLASAGVRVRRWSHGEGLPMHAKFLVVQTPDREIVFFGSYNFNPSSRWLNQEVLVRSEEPDLIAAFKARFETLAAEAGGV